MTPFIMSPDVEKTLKDLSKLAEKEDRILPAETLKKHAESFDPDSSEGQHSPYPLDQTVDLPLGWKVTMSFERQPVGLSRHMSMSSPVKGRCPAPQAVQWTMLQLGFVRPLEQCVVYKETYAVGRVAINVIEPVNPTL